MLRTRNQSSRIDLAYGDDPRHTLDLYLPASGSTDTVVVFWHGGSWKDGDKATYGFVGRALTRKGVAVAIPNYRLYPQVLFPAFIEDAARAVTWIQQTYKLKQTVLMGHSAGAHIAAVLALDPRYLKAATHGAESVRPHIAGVIGLSGPYDFNPRQALQPIFHGSSPAQWKPINLVGKRAPAFPFLLLHGRLDPTVAYRNSVSLAHAINQAKGHATVILYPYFEHIGTLASLLPAFRLVSPVYRHVSRFLDELTILPQS